MKNVTITKIIFLMALLSFSQIAAFAQKAELVLRTGHLSSVNSIAFSPDGKVFVSGGGDNTIKLWSTVDGKELRTFQGHTSSVRSVAFSPDGKIIASGSWDKTIKIWDAITGNELQTFYGHTSWVNSVAFSPEGNTLASCSTDNTIKIWDIATGNVINTFEGNASVWAVAFSPDGKWLASGSSDKTIKLWDVSRATPIRTFYGHTQLIESIVFSPDGKIIASSSRGNEQIIKETPLDTSEIKLWEVQTGKEIYALSSHVDTVNSVAFSPDGRLLASASIDKTIKLWDATTGQELKTVEGNTSLVYSVAFSPDGKKLVYGSYGIIKVLDLTNEKELYTSAGHGSHIGSIAFSSNGKTLAINNGSDFELWNLTTAQKIQTIEADTFWEESFAFSPNGEIFACVFKDKIKISDAITGQELSTLKGHTSSIYSLKFSLDSKILASGSSDETIKLWDLTSRRDIKTLKGHSDSIYSLTFSLDSKLLASGGWDNTVKLWDVESGQEIKTFTGHTERITSVAFSSDNKILASGSFDKTVKLWDIEKKQELITLNGHVWSINLIAFSPDNKTLTSRSEIDNIVKLWNVKSGEALGQNSLDNSNDVNQILNRFPTFFNENKGDIVIINNWLEIKKDEKDENSKLNLYSLKNGKLVASFIFLDKTDWAVIDPEGRFDASRGAEKLMHFVVGLEPVDLEQIKDRYYTPNLLQRIFKGENLDETRKVSVFTTDELYPLAEYEPLKANETIVNVKLRNRGGGIGRVQVFVNDAEFLADARPKGFDPKSKSAELKIDFSNAKTLKKGEPNSIKIIARNEAGWLRNRGSEIIYVDEREKDGEPQEFYAIIGGVSDYENDAFNLQYSAKDARDFAKAIELGAAKLFGKERVHIRLLASGSEDRNAVLTGADSKSIAPTKENFRRTFEEFRKAKPTDVFVVYLAGHGTSINRGGDTGDTYLYLTQEAVTTDKSRLLDEKLRNATTVSSEELAEWIRDVPALKRAMILDTCAAGAVEASLVKPRDLSPDQIKALDRMKDRTGFYVLMGSAADAQSYEATRYGQGLLTYSLLQGLSGARLRNGEYADVSTLFNYAEDTVTEMAKGIGGIQQPRIIAPTESRSFDIGQFSPAEKSKFTLAQIKPLILKPAFFNKTANFDDNEISAEVEKTLRDESTIMPRGNGESNFVFVEANEMNDAITPSGVYEINGNQIKVTLILVINKKPFKTITVEGNTEKKKELSQKIVRAVIENAPIVIPAI